MALRETQESPNLPLLHGEKDLELPAGLRRRRGTFGGLCRVPWKSCLTASVLVCPLVASPSTCSLSFSSAPRLLSNRALMETTTPVTDAAVPQSFAVEDGA